MPDTTSSKKTVTLGKVSWAGQGGGDYYGKNALEERIPVNRADIKYITSSGQSVSEIRAEQPFLTPGAVPPTKPVEYGLVTRYDAATGKRIPDRIQEDARLAVNVAKQASQAGKLQYEANRLKAENDQLRKKTAKFFNVNISSL